MAQLVLSNAGQYAGGRLLPNGVSVFGRQISGEALGQTIGSIAGAAIDQQVFAPRLEGPRIAELHLTQSREGAAIPNVYGRMRVGGSVIWAARFHEHRDKSGGKGGPKVTSYAYTLSFAVALCEGVASQVTRIWANGEPMNLSQVNWRFYPGSPDQAPDALIEAVEGVGHAPAYAGTAYVVFEDLPLDAYGGRMPQLSFEVERACGGNDRMEAQVTAVNLIPGAGEFAYATQVIQRETSELAFAPENMNNGSGEADFLVSLDQLLATFPNLASVNLVVGWFGDSLDCAQCLVRPGVERRDRRTRPLQWSVAGQVRETAYMVSRDAQDRPRYGGTPDDAAVRQAIAALKARGLRVTLYPFLFMDTPGLDWRGRISCAPGHEGAALAADDVAAFFGSGTDWRYRRFIRHYAQLAAEAGADDFLIGSELVGLTRVRSASGVYPAVSQLKALAGECRAILGPDVGLSYAADWTEYGAFVPDDGSGDVDFPLDDLWADPNVDFIALDWYPPMADWREGDNHLDAVRFKDAHDPAGLAADIEGGEGYDWFYADASDRAIQHRTPIDDTAHGEHWVFRQKDIRNWWSHSHHRRPGGVRDAAPTAWTPMSKPVRFAEFGCPAVDKGANQPNVFFDPKSVESALPHFSTGARDDLIQRRVIDAFAAHWAGDPLLDAAAPISVWAWDMRPWPNWPAREDLWSDGPNWRTGHWLNGRAGLAMLQDVVADIASRAGVAAEVSGLAGVVTGYGLSGVMSARDALEPLKTAYGFVVNERPGGLVFRMPDNAPVPLTDDEIVLAGEGRGVAVVRRNMDKPATRTRLGFIDAEADHLPGVVISDGAAHEPVHDIALALVLDRSQAQVLADDLHRRTLEAARGALLSLSPALATLEPGDRIQVQGQVFRVSRLRDSLALQVDAVEAGGGTTLLAAGALPHPQAPVVVDGTPIVVVADAPALPGAAQDARPLVFAAARPWTGPLDVLAGAQGAMQTLRATISNPGAMGKLAQDLPPGPVGRWQDIRIDVDMLTADALETRSDFDVLNGANLALVGQSQAPWEMVQFTRAELVSPGRYRIGGWLRGQQGSDDAAAAGAPAGAWFLPIGGEVARLDLTDAELHLDIGWSAQRRDSDRVEGGLVWQAKAHRPWAPAFLRATMTPEGLALSWVRRGSGGADGWDVAEPALVLPERYRVTILVAGVSVRVVDAPAPACLWTAAEMAQDAGGASACDIAVAQLAPDGRPGLAARITVAI